ncbi:hypothetical protein BDV09DRAFT_186275 [Aspergillus tetrazonus]
MDQVLNDPVALRPCIQDATDPAVSNTRLHVLDWVDAHRVQSPRAYELPIPKWPLDGLSLLIDHYKIPTAIFEGGIRAVTHSFGSLDTEDGYRCCWFDYLCKNITVAQIPGSEPVISGQSPGPVQQIRQTDMIYDRLTRLSCEAVKEGVIHDPMSLLVVVLHQLSARMDDTVWNLSMVFGGIESKALGLHRNRESFTGLHNISKHIIYLQESSDAALEHATEEERAAGKLTRRTIAQVEADLGRRMQNVIALHHGYIAFVTLVFLPITTVSTIFGSQFFNTAPDNASIEVSKDFWIFWVVSIPLTLAVLFGWSLWQRKALVGSHIAWKAISGPSNSTTLSMPQVERNRDEHSLFSFMSLPWSTRRRTASSIELPNLTRMSSWRRPNP